MTNLNLWHFLAMAPPQTAGYCIRSVGQLRAQAALGARPVAVMSAGYAASTRGRFGFSGEPFFQRDGLDYAVYTPSALDKAPVLTRLAQTAVEAPLINRLRLYDGLLDRAGRVYLDALAQRLPPPDAVIVHTPALATGYAFALRERFPNVPFVFDVHGLNDLTLLVRHGEGFRHSIAYRKLRAAEKHAIERSDAIFSISQAVSGELARRGADPERILVVPNGIDKEQFPERNPEATAQLRRSFGAGSKHLIGSITSILDYEGLDVLFRATRILVDRGMDVSALIVGSGPRESALRTLARELALGDRAIFAGRRPHKEVAAIYKVFDIFVLPRLDFEVTRLVPPIKLAEAMANGCPLVASDLPILREAVPNRFAQFFEPGRPEALASRCAALLENDARRIEQAAALRTWTLENLDWKVLCRKQIERIAERRRTASRVR